MKYLVILLVLSGLFSAYLFWMVLQLNAQMILIAQGMHNLGSAVTTTASSDTLETFRQNVNASLSSLQNDRVATTSAFTWTALQKFFGNASSTAFSAHTANIGATATTSFAGDGSVTMNATTTIANAVGVASTSPFTRIGIGTAGATSTIAGGKFCAYFQDSNGRGMWVTLSISGNTVFSTSTASCKN